MTPLTIHLPDPLAREVEEAGLLAPATVEAIFRESLRRWHLGQLLRQMDEVHAARLPPMTMDEIQAEVNAVRAERRRPAARS